MKQKQGQCGELLAEERGDWDWWGKGEVVNSGVIRWILGSFLLLQATAWGHVVEQFYAEFEREADGRWTLEIQFDAGYADPATRGDADQPAPSREWLLARGSDEWAEMRDEAVRYLDEMLGWRVRGWAGPEFPDFGASPPDFPRLLNEGAYFRVVFRGVGEARSAVAAGYPSLVILVDGEHLLIGPGDEMVVHRPGAWESAWMWVKQGFLHVLPLGWDHVLFMVALFFYRREWRPLLGQSLAFTVAHTFSLALAAAGVVLVPGKLVEVLIAVSLVWVGLENLGPRKVLKWRLVLVFGLGLLHGLGFAGALAPWLGGGERFVPSVLLMNLGVEVAQVTVLGGLWLLTIGWSGRPWFPQVRKGGSLLVAAAGLWWVVARLAG